MSSKLTVWILVAAAAGVLAGWAGHELSPDAAAAASLAGSFSILSDVFLRLIKMIIAPLVFATVVAGIAGAGDAKTVGRIGGKAILWFVSASLVSLLLGMLFANLLGPGRDLALPLPEKDAATNLKTGGLNLGNSSPTSSRAASSRRWRPTRSSRSWCSRASSASRSPRFGASLRPR